MSGDLADLTASDIVSLVCARAVSPVEVVRAAVDRIERLDPTLNAMVTLDEGALEAARALETRLSRGDRPGVLCGVPVGIKDVTPVAGLRTTYGSPLYRHHVPDTDALVVQRLRAAGAIVMGKTNTPEFAAGGSTFNEVFGRTRNPWDPARTPGGSTGGGAAATAAGMIAVAEGTDLGGSLRIPAAFCGLVGLRPTPGLVPTWPTPWVWDDLSVSGPMARTAADVARALQAMAGPDPRSPLGRPIDGRDFSSGLEALTLDGLRVLYAADPARAGIAPDIAAICRTAAFALADGGAVVEAVELDLSEAKKAFLHLRGVWMVTHMRPHMDRLDEVGPNVRGNVEAGLALTPAQIGWAHEVRGAVWATFERLFRAHDFLLTPTASIPPFAVELDYPKVAGDGPAKTYVDWIAPTSVLSLTGLPVASVPCGLDQDGLPVGVQVVGPPASEERVLGLCARIQEAFPIGRPSLLGDGPPDEIRP